MEKDLRIPEEITKQEIDRQAKFGMEPSGIDFVIAGMEESKAQLVKDRRGRPEFNNVLEADAHNWATREVDRPDREKALYDIRVLLWRYFREQLTPEIVDAIAEEIYNTIRSICPAGEEIRKREGERIVDWIDRNNTWSVEHGLNIGSATWQPFRQVLKGKEEEDGIIEDK